MDVDLSAFPIIRLDHIPYVDDETLNNAASEIEYMLETSDNSNPKLDKYLMKQYDVMKKQIAERSAASRISQLLNGAQNLLNQPIDYSSFFETKRQPQPLEADKSIVLEKDEKLSKPDKAPEVSRTFVPLPLPSQRIRATTVEKNEVPELALTSQSLQTTSAGEHKDGNTSPRSINSSRSNHSRRSGGGNSELDDQPSKKSLEVVYKNFGSTFVVAATEKRRRFYPKKATESPEEIKQKEKTKRRKVAMQRLLKRKEEREAIQQKRREKRKLEKIAAQKALKEEKKKESEKTLQPESSDSESVSGGDDDREIQVDETVVQSVQQALETINHTANPETLPIPPPKSVSVELKLKDTQKPPLPTKKRVEVNSVNAGSSKRNQQQKPIFSKSQKIIKEGSNCSPLVSTAEELCNHATSSITNEDSDIAERNKEFQAKNLAALMTIRKMKEAKMKNSQVEVEAKVYPLQGEGGDQTTELKNDVNEESAEIQQTNADTITKNAKNCGENDLVDETEKISSFSKTAEDGIEIIELPQENITDLVVETKSAQQEISFTQKNLDLFDFVDGVYIFNFAPDDIPGLACFKWDNKWEIDISNYSSIVDNNSSSQVFTLRAKDRQSVPFGLILLCEECKDVLIGKLTISTIEEFVNIWQECISNFDHQSISSHQIDENDLFQMVTTCGNGFTTCRKLEKLVQQYFHPNKVDPENYTLSQRLNIGVDEELDIQLIEDIVLCRESVEVVNNDDDLPYESVDELQGGNSEAEIVEGINDSSIAPDDLLSPDVIENDEVETNERLDFQINDSGTTEIDNTSADAVSSKSNLKKKSLESLNTLRKSRDNIRAPRSSVPKSLSNNTKLPSNSLSDGTRLIDFYPHFGMIFPVAYKQLGSVREDGGAAARALIESMQLQAQLYEDWVEVMKDYSTVFCCADQEEEDSDGAKERSAEVYKGGSNTLHFRIKSSRSEVFNIISDVFSKQLPDWIQLPSGLGLGLSWNLLWTWSKPHINMSHLLIWQRVNHFEDSKQLTRKDLLKKNIQRYVDIGHKSSAEFEIMPKTFLLPHEYTQFVQSFTYYENMKKEEIKNIGTTSLHNYWILKPVGLSRGRGISLITDINDITYSQASVIQKYIERPLCLHGYKFDLRIYVVVTSFHPLEAFIYKDGFARVSTQEYSLNSNDAQNKFIHLTNSSIQKYNMNEIKSNNPISEQSDENCAEEASDVGGSKISLLGNNGLWNRLKLFGIDVNQVWQDMCLCIVKSLVMVDEKIAYQPCCFELFGYDILIDSNLRPWLLEVNASPSLARENHLDHRVKNALIHDIIRLLDVAAYDREALAKVLRKRLQSITSKKRYLYGANDTELEQDLRSILGDYRPRRYGEPPKHIGQFECLCPNTKNYEQVLKLKKKILKPMNEEG